MSNNLPHGDNNDAQNAHETANLDNERHSYPSDRELTDIAAIDLPEQEKKELRKRNYIFVGVTTLIAGFLLGAWVLVNPQNPFTALFRSEIVDTGGRVIKGPYPNAADFKKLKAAKVTTIVSLLDPRLPYEGVLLEQEKEIAKKYGIKVLNFPMASVLGKRMGDDYKQRVMAASDSIEKAEGKVYLHCYLGVHRSVDIQQQLAARGVTTGDYTGRAIDADNKQVRQAESFYEEGKYAEAVALAHPVMNTGSEFNVRAANIAGWSQYQLGEYAHAYNIFRQAIIDRPKTVDGRVGLAYAAMQMKDYETAVQNFQWVVANEPTSGSANVGLALCYHRMDNDVEALKYAQAAYKYDPDNSEAKALLQVLHPESLQTTPETQVTTKVATSTGNTPIKKAAHAPVH